MLCQHGGTGCRCSGGNVRDTGSGQGEGLFTLDMNYDSTPVPDQQAPDPKGRTWLPEAIAVVAIFVVLWIAFALHMIQDGLRW